MLKALIFDVDGTLADTESLHLEAFNAAFKKVGLDWHWTVSMYAGLLDVAGGKERILHYWKMHDPEEAHGTQVPKVVQEIHTIKNHYYKEHVDSGRLKLRPGVKRLIYEAYAESITMAIATTTSPANVSCLLDHEFGESWRKIFSVICDGSTTEKKKPAPDVYRAVLRGLSLNPKDCIAFEDSENGLRAASWAGITTVVTPTAFTRGHNFDRAWLVLADLDEQITDSKVANALPDSARMDVATLRYLHQSNIRETVQ